MTIVGHNPPMKTDITQNHSVAILVSDGLGLFEFGIATEIFGLERPEFDFPWYDFSVVSASDMQVRATAGVQVTAEYGLNHLEFVDTIVIPSWRKSNEPESSVVLDAIRSATERGARIISICSGVFLLAAAGLLDGKEVTTHWKHVGRLKALYPNIRVNPDSIYIDHGNIICSAGSSAGIDACMHLVKRDYGASVANDVARRLVASPHRIGGQKQFIKTPLEVKPKHTISVAMEWAIEHLAEPINVKQMANFVHMSERTFLRRFHETVGCTPSEWLQSARVAKAQEYLENSGDKLALIADKSGYQSLETFRTAFKRVTGVSASAYRARFNHS